MDSTKQTVAAFDFDGTFIRADSMTPYLRLFYSRREMFRIGRSVLPYLVGYQLGRVPRRQAKEFLLTQFLGGKTVEELEQKAQILADTVLPSRIRPKALEKLRWHQEQGHRCVLVTASLTLWTKAFAHKYGLDLVATLPEVIDGKFTGRLQGTNNYGPEKVRRLEALIPPETIEFLYAYGDTSGDRELLARADEGLYRPFH